MILVLIVAVAFIWPEVEAAINREVYIEFGMGANPYMGTPEYQIEGTDVEDTRDRKASLLGDVQLTSYEKNGTRITAELASSEGGTVEFPLFAFDGYKAELAGQELTIARGSNNRIRIDIPAGASGELRVWFAGNPLWRISDAVSLITLFALGGHLIRKRKNATLA